MNWQDYTKIAEELHKQYPSACPVTMPEAELIEKVTALSGFTGDKEPPSDIYTSAIAKKWILVKDGGRTKVVNDDPFV